MNRLVRQSLNIWPKKIRPAMKNIRERAMKRQNAWMKRRESDIRDLKRMGAAFRDKAIDFIGEWVEIDGVTTKAALEVRPHKSEWAIFEAGAYGGPLRTFSKKIDAIDEAKRLAKSRGCQVKVFTKQGLVQNTFTFQTA